MIKEYRTTYGRILHEDSLQFMQDKVKDESADLIFTSPPFALLRKKDYGNKEEHGYAPQSC